MRDRDHIEALLQPSLSADESSPKALYSERALFFVAFFGGAIAAVIFSALNSRILGRFNRDLPYYLAPLAVLFLFFLYIIFWASHPTDPDSFRQYMYIHGNPWMRYGSRAIAILMAWPLCFALHRKFHKAMDLMAIEPLNGWYTGIACTIIGGLTQHFIMFLMIYASIT